MSSSRDDSPLNELQQDVVDDRLSRFSDYLSTKGRNPKKEKGYAEGTVTERLSRFRLLMKWIWAQEELTTEFVPQHGNIVNEALEEDTLRKQDGGRYSENTKRKFNDVLRNWFEFQNEDWEPTYTFSDNDPDPENKPDPYSKEELRQLTEASLTFEDIPRYNNLSPSERDQWKIHISQKLEKPKDEVVPADWDKINNSWKIPSLVRTVRGHGWRPALVGRMKTDWYDWDEQAIFIPASASPKNDASWREDLIDEEAMWLEKWLDQRSLMDKYKDRDEIWLTRKGNPYSSGPLNDLLDKLQDEAGINPRGRKLVWYSFRHSVGTYVYDEYKDLDIVRRKLRQKSKESAINYIHPLPETQREATSVL